MSIQYISVFTFLSQMFTECSRRTYKAAETYVACSPGANANTFLSSCSGQINCFYLCCFYLGSLLLIGPHNPWWDKLDRHTCGYTHTHPGYILSVPVCMCISVCLCSHACVHVCVPASMCVLVCACLEAPESESAGPDACE